VRIWFAGSKSSRRRWRHTRRETYDPQEAGGSRWRHVDLPGPFDSAGRIRTGRNTASTCTSPVGSAPARAVA